jgi:hypothetical protein
MQGEYVHFGSRLGLKSKQGQRKEWPFPLGVAALR